MGMVVGMGRFGLTSRLALALAGIAILSVGLAAVLTSWEIEGEIHITAAVIAAVLGLWIGVFIAVSLARPLKSLTDIAEQMTQGDLSVNIKPGGGSEIERLGGALDHLATTLKQQEAARKKTVSDIAHELRTPLAIIVSQIEAAQDGVLEDLPQNLQVLHTEAQRLTGLIDDLERMADADQPRLFITKTPVDLAEIVRKRAEAYSGFFQAKGIAFDQELEPAMVNGDARRLDQITDNLLSNALRYTLPEGTVKVRTGIEEGFAVLEVVDSGIGITPEEQDHVFERFWRGEQARSFATGGAGVGLSVTRELVSVHNGHIELDSSPGGGSTFRVLLPHYGTD